MKAVIINCTLKRMPAESNTEALATVVAAELASLGVDVKWFRAVDLNLPPGVKTKEGDADEWPTVHDALLDAEILIVASPTWLGRPASPARSRTRWAARPRRPSGSWSGWTP